MRRAVGDVVEEMDAARRKSVAFVLRGAHAEGGVPSDPSMRRASRSFSRVTRPATPAQASPARDIMFQFHLPVSHVR